jgi:propionate CoA-transferase
VRRIVAHRALLALGSLARPGALINIGVGMPEGVAALVPVAGPAHIPASLPFTLSTEAGAIGGTPAGGRLFGAALHPAAFTSTAAMLDLYNGGALAVAVLGMAEVNAAGDVNVSRFPGRTPGCGGFIDISQSARSVVFVGTFTSGGLAVAVEEDGGGCPRLRIAREGRHRKFRAAVVEKTFAGCSGGGRPVLYVTERAVFRLVEVDVGGGGTTTSTSTTALELVEVAPGVDVERDVLGQMDFAPRVARPLGVMDARCFGWAVKAKAGGGARGL